MISFFTVGNECRKSICRKLLLCPMCRFGMKDNYRHREWHPRGQRNNLEQKFRSDSKILVCRRGWEPPRAVLRSADDQPNPDLLVRWAFEQRIDKCWCCDFSVLFIFWTWILRCVSGCQYFTESPLLFALGGRVSFGVSLDVLRIWSQKVLKKMLILRERWDS